MSGSRRLTLTGAMLVAAVSGSLRLDAQTAGATSSRLSFELPWRCIGPFDGGPVASVEGVAGTPGVYLITTPSGGTWKTTDGGDTWSSVESAGLKVQSAGLTPGSSSTSSWTDPANPRRIARAESQGIAVSLDGGTTWMPSHHLPIAEVAHLTPRSRPLEPSGSHQSIGGAPVTVSIADPVRAGLIFAGTKNGVSVSFDNGVRWASLQSNMPAVAIKDLDIRGNDLIAATQGRSVWSLDDISPLRQIDAAGGPVATMLFKPADVTLASPGSVALDYWLATGPKAPITVEVLDASNRVVHDVTSAPPDTTDRWLAVERPLPATPGHHRTRWNLRVDPPPSPHHRFAQHARALFEDTPAEPDGPEVLAGTYRVRLTVDGHVYTQPLVVRNDPGASAASLAAAESQFAFEMKAYDAMQIAHRGYLQLRRLRDGLRPLVASSDPDVAAEAAELDGRLNAIDGSDWTGLVIPDAEDEVNGEDEAKEGKHPDFVPPKPVSLSKDYDDPTSILGRAFGNVDHAPAFAILGTKLGEMLTAVGARAAAPDALAAGNYDASCQQLAEVLETWRAVNTQDLPRLNAELATRKLAALPIASSVPSIACR